MSLFRRLFEKLKSRASAPSPVAGNEWEERAALFLRSKGLQILDRNVRARRGELDIVALDGSEIVFVEVKARKHETFGGPGAAINRKKRVRLISAAKQYLATRRLNGRRCRFDAVLIYTADEPPRVEHLVNAFGEQDV